MKQTDFQNGTQITKDRLIRAYADWLEGKRNEWALFAVTATFQSSGQNPNRIRWEDEYRQKVVWKFNKRLSRHNVNRIAFDGLYVYEFGESSRMKLRADRRRPHHVHGIIAIPIEMAGRIWNAANDETDHRLKSDLDSIKSISSVLIEPLQENMAIAWLFYMSKEKGLDRI